MVLKTDAEPGAELVRTLQGRDGINRVGTAKLPPLA